MSAKNEMISLFLGATLSRAIYVASQLGIADEIKEKPLDIECLAKKVGANPKALYRLLRMLATRGIFSESPGKVFSLTDLGSCLTSDHPDSLKEFFEMDDETRWRSLGQLKKAVQKGEPAFDQIYGKNYFEYLAADSKKNDQFERGMSNLSMDEDESIAKCLKLNGAVIVVDIGGGRGGFLAKILQGNPTIQGILFELPHVVFPKDNLLLKEVDDRCTIISGSFLESIPEGGDVYMMKRVLHDWDDDTCLTILKNCRNSLKKDSKIFIVESLVPEGDHPSMIKDLDVYMMALFPGCERTKEEFSTLFNQAGLELVGVESTNSELSILEVKITH